MTYRVVEENNNLNIIEKETGHKIYETTKSSKARNICRKLNLGYGFNGLTPQFFLTDYKKRLT